MRKLRRLSPADVREILLAHAGEDNAGDVNYCGDCPGCWAEAQDFAKSLRRVAKTYDALSSTDPAKADVVISDKLHEICDDMWMEGEDACALMTAFRDKLGLR